jgi:hypothetical protein
VIFSGGAKENAAAGAGLFRIEDEPAPNAQGSKPECSHGGILPSIGTFRIAREFSIALEADRRPRTQVSREVQEIKKHVQ